MLPQVRAGLAMKAAGGRFLTKSKPGVVFPSPAAAPSPCTEEPGLEGWDGHIVVCKGLN